MDQQWSYHYTYYIERRMQHSKNTGSLHWTVWKHIISVGNAITDLES